MSVTVGAADAAIYRITVGASTIADVKNIQTIPAKLQSTTKLSFYPNPATTVLHLNNSIEIAGLQLTEFGTGHTVKKFSNINNTHYELDLNGLSPGYYVINVTDNKGTTKGYKIYKY